MKAFLKQYSLLAIILAAPFIRHFSENSTVDALAGLAVWTILWVTFLLVLVFLGIGAAFHIWSEEIKVDKLDEVLKPFERMKWWKSAISMSLVLGTYIYVEWTGPAILYAITSVGMYAGMALFKSGVTKVAFVREYLEAE